VSWNQSILGGSIITTLEFLTKGSLAENFNIKDSVKLSMFAFRTYPNSKTSLKYHLFFDVSTVRLTLFEGAMTLRVDFEGQSRGVSSVKRHFLFA
jgi:hypothetical protein